ncbi:MAG: hypothetical protein KR126chlam2_00917 [Chlamydiae bacterium]|nr:hypothetical protein [Chlamydiota bacterium]
MRSMKPPVGYLRFKKYDHISRLVSLIDIPKHVIQSVCITAALTAVPIVIVSKITAGEPLLSLSTYRSKESLLSPLPSMKKGLTISKANPSLSSHSE